MKRSISVLLAIIALLFSLASCEEKLPDRSDAGHTEEELSLYEIADKTIMDKFHTKNLSEFKVSLHYLSDGRIEVRYELELYGIPTNEDYSVYLSPEHEVVDIYSNDVGIYSRFVNDKNFEKALSSAKEGIEEQAQRHGKEISDNMLYYVEKDGYLFLYHEIIVDIDPPNYETDQYGDVIEGGGCGIDHDHVLLSEQICPVS